MLDSGPSEWANYNASTQTASCCMIVRRLSREAQKRQRLDAPVASRLTSRAHHGGDLARACCSAMCDVHADATSDSALYI